MTSRRPAPGCPAPGPVPDHPVPDDPVTGPAVTHPAVTGPAVTEHAVTGGGGVRLRVREAGDPSGQPLLFLHGWSQCGLAWDAQFGSDLADEFRLVAVDLRGHGWSDKPDDGYDDPALWAADLHAVLTERELTRPVVVAWSYAGLMVCDYLRAHGDRALGGVQLVGAISELGTPTASVGIAAEFVAAARRSYRTDVRECVEGIREYLSLVMGEGAADRELAQVLGYNVLVPPEVRKKLFLRRVRNDDVLRALTVPVLITHGMRDRVVLPSVGARHAALIPEAQSSHYPGSGHAPFRDAPDRFNQELREFALRCRE